MSADGEDRPEEADRDEGTEPGEDGGADTPDFEVTRVGELTVAEVRRMLVTTVVLLVVVGLFLFMVRPVFLSAILGVVVAVYLRPLHCRLEDRVGRAAAGIASLSILLIPPLAAAVYGYMELRRAAEYLSENGSQVAAEIAGHLRGLPMVDGDPTAQVEQGVQRAAEWATELPAALQGAAGPTAVALSVFLFTAFYVLTQAEAIVHWLRCRVAERYLPLLQSLEANASGALYGAVYATLLSQGLKAGVILVLNLALGVPLALTLALLVFVIGFFPVVGAWTIYLPTGVYLLVFQDSPAKAALMVGLSAVLCTGVISMYLRPKIAAGHSKVLDFYWMFLGLVAGVFAFGLPGIVAGPLVIALLKAMLDTIVSAREDDEDGDDGGGPRGEDDDGPRAEIMDEDEVAEADEGSGPDREDEDDEDGDDDEERGRPRPDRREGPGAG